ncbi:hypothetical protein GQX73_g2849 [Xylaria multiplex]|uniref:Uncharacterized protein n=1 Tax=Xylaria multiplex TaxID=323545 RepID=A0A7C8J0C1_9PEZI|nr:hypothetical protein GQX73_g2849 [Xylaria multiplex]
MSAELQGFQQCTCNAFFRTDTELESHILDEYITSSQDAGRVERAKSHSKVRHDNEDEDAADDQDDQDDTALQKHRGPDGRFHCPERSCDRVTEKLYTLRRHYGWHVRLYYEPCLALAPAKGEYLLLTASGMKRKRQRAASNPRTARGARLESDVTTQHVTSHILPYQEVESLPSNTEPYTMVHQSATVHCQEPQTMPVQQPNTLSSTTILAQQSHDFDHHFFSLNANALSSSDQQVPACHGNMSYSHFAPIFSTGNYAMM